ncbi:acyltransferase family protein [Hydrogenophaga pseudoflava]|uniref:acyltransferase family protein n=1 Tax=Hydrogenophaga pseudoflava TaxID=47421 RepID=UPI0027E4E65B|nr:acyltransferase family protein [Hydrogenophaga pseudoflava]MDQ7745528.1 acyltransferase family protein [Hydrogenophaga pseudoflava]
MSDTARPDLHGLMAVVGVVLHHAFPVQFQGGAAGVEALLVIAGYLVGSAVLSGLRTQEFSMAAFWAQGIRRLFPALVLVLAAAVVAGWFLLPPADYRRLGQEVQAVSTFFTNAVWLGEAAPSEAGSASKPFQHLWPLAVGVPFCLLWPLALWAMHRWRLNAMGWTAGVLLLSFLLHLHLAQHPTAVSFQHPASWLWVLLTGALVATVPESKRNERPNALAWCGAALLILALLPLTPEHAVRGWWGLLPTLGTALLIAAGPRAWLNRRVLSSGPLGWVGLIAYPLYLWHWPLLWFAQLKSAHDPGGGQAMASMALALVLAWTTWRFVERLFRSGLLNGAASTATLGLALGLVATAGWGVQRHEGLEQRVPELVRHLQTTGGRSAVIQGWRDKDCMLDYRLPPSHYKPFCIEQKRPLVFLWGDSHAGSLYPGFKALKESGHHEFGLAERTAAICPPVLGIEPRPLCRSLNEANIQAIRDIRPDVVILYAWWHNKRYDLRNLEATVEQIRQAGVPRIVLLGAVPYWKKHLPQILLEEWKKGPVQAHPPLRLGEEFLDPDVRRATDIMRDRARQMGIGFISGMDYFCDAGGCLTRLSEDATQPLSYDYGHLSTGAAAYYIEQLVPRILSGTR